MNSWRIYYATVRYLEPMKKRVKGIYCLEADWGGVKDKITVDRSSASLSRRKIFACGMFTTTLALGKSRILSRQMESARV